MAGLLGGMNLRKPNIPANTGGAMAQGLTTGMQMGQNIWENIQRNAQWNMTKDITSMTNYGNIALDSNKPTNTRISAAHNYNNFAKKIDPQYRDMFFNENGEFYPSDEAKKLNKKMSNIMKGKDVSSQKLVDIKGLLEEFGRNSEYPQYKGIVEKGEDEAAKQGLLGLNSQKFGLNPLQPNEWTPTIEHGQKLNEFNTQQGLLMTQPYETLEKMATATEPRDYVKEHKETREFDIANPIPPSVPTPQYDYYTNDKGEKVKVNAITGVQEILGKEWQTPKEYNPSKDIAVIKMIMNKALPQSSLFQISNEGDILGIAQSKGDIIDAYLNKTPKDKAIYNAAIKRINKYYGISETLETQNIPQGEKKPIPVFK